MALGKRKRGGKIMFMKTKRGASMVKRYVKRARRQGTSISLGMNSRLRSLERLVETKEVGAKTNTNLAIPQNNMVTLFDLFENITQGVSDPMGPTTASSSRIGDRITVRGVALRGFIENALDRSKVHYRILVLKGAKGDTFDRSTIFKGMADNKMIDQINTERFTIVAQRVITCSAAQHAPSHVNPTGVPYYSGPPGVAPAGIATRTFKLWIPGAKMAKNGQIQYENNGTQPKFFDYKVMVFAYDWFGTPQDVNNVGKINECWSKVYYRDA